MKLRSHLALIATATLLPVVVFSAIALNMLLDAERKAVLRSLHETARSTALMIDREIGSAETGLKVLGTSARLSAGDLAGFYEQARLMRVGSGSWTVLLDSDGQQIVNTVVPFGSVLPLPSPAVREGVRSILRSERTVVSDLVTGTLTKRYLTTVNVPVSAVAGKRYVLSQVFAADHFMEIFRQNRIPATWTVAVIDHAGNFIARSRQPEQMVGRAARPELVKAASTIADGEIRHKTLEGLDSFDVFTHSPLSGWTVAVAVPAEAVEASARKAVLVAAAGLLAALLAAAGTAALVSRRLLTSIGGVDTAAAALARGEPPPPVRTGVAELDRLARSLTGAGTVLLQEKQSRLAAESERARLLENERIARLDAELQNRQKDQFLAMLGHELRNPLSAISGAIAVMKARDASAALNVRAHTIIERQSNHLSHIVDDLLDLSRMSMGRIILEKQPLDLAAVVHASIDTLHAAGRVGACDIGIEAEPVWIDADRTRLDQILGNVLGNALKFSSRKGRIDITVSGSANEAVWTVRDFGIGISPDLMPNIFDAFVQGAAQADHALGGLGVGLNLVRQLVKLHGGTITVSSTGIGAGTLVEIRFPRRSMPVAPAAAEESVPVITGTDMAPPAMSTVLLIEDNVDSREMMAMLLGMLGYQVLEAANGVDGLQLARSRQPAIAVVDIGLPDMDGYEIARQLRADAGLQNMTLIALTGYGQDADRKRAMEAGFDSHLVKPLDMDVLVNTIVSHKAKRQAHLHGTQPGV